jgi:hypothetical protein
MPGLCYYLLTSTMSNLSEDLIACRQRLKISLEDISKSTRVPVSLFASIENGTFFSDPAFTRTYIRSFTRMYARAIKIEEVDIVRALDEEEAEMYDGFLVEKYIGGSSKTKTSTPAVNSPKEIVDQPAQITVPVVTSVEPIPPTPVTPAKQVNAGQTSENQPLRTPIATDRSVDWADMNAKINQPRRNSSTPLYLIGALVLIIAAATVIYFMFFPIDIGNGEAELINQQQDPVVADTIPALPPPPVSVALPDTLNVTIYALRDKLDPIRINSDLQERPNPYWLELGTARRFIFRDTIIFRADPRKFVLIYNGHLISNLAPYRFDEDSINFRFTRNLLLEKTEWATQGNLPDSVRTPAVIQ